jgi:hypothetical protein
VCCWGYFSTVFFVCQSLIPKNKNFVKLYKNEVAIFRQNNNAAKALAALLWVIFPLLPA